MYNKKEWTKLIADNKNDNVWGDLDSVFVLKVH